MYHPFHAVTPEKIKEGNIYPDLVELRPISATVATAVAEAAFDLGVAGMQTARAAAVQSLCSFCDSHMDSGCLFLLFQALTNPRTLANTSEARCGCLARWAGTMLLCSVG